MTDEQKLRATNGGSRPVPDPTVLTTEQLHREIAAAVRLLQAEGEGRMNLFRSEIQSIQDANAIRFANIEKEFALVENRRVEQKVDTKTAVDAALQAAKSAVNEQTVAQEKAITKSETAAAEQSKQQYATFSASLKGVTDTVADLKERVATIEAIKIGATETKVGTNQNIGLIISLVLFSIAIVTFALSFQK